MIRSEPNRGQPRVVVVGAGAVGCFFGGMLARAGASVTLLGRPGSTSPHLASIERQGLRIDGVEIQETVPVAVSRDPQAVENAELILFAVKTNDTETAARSIATHVALGAVVVSLQNGVENTELMARVGVRALPSVVFVAAAIERPGAIRHRGRGDLVLGQEEDPEAAQRASQWFEAAGVPCPIADDFPRAQWTKLIINAMANSISALTGTSYRALAEYEPTWNLAVTAAREAVEVAHGLGIAVDLEEIVATARGVVNAIGDATSSTEQDLSRGRPTEIQSLNGVISRHGAELGIATPTHDALVALVGLRERQS